MLCLTMGPESRDLWNETSVVRVESLFLFQKEIEDVQTL
ncbi:rCG59385 [Rattus norvegicus]|uniref:RCG59385 n=1 Tax=Rattus norvegicus TaxID=10116 RepID=A6HR87_RAT|nr:rCG59385 [Rattus norvegicus]